MPCIFLCEFCLTYNRSMTAFKRHVVGLWHSRPHLMLNKIKIKLQCRH